MSSLPRRFLPGSTRLRGLSNRFDVLKNGEHLLVVGDDAGKGLRLFKRVGENVLLESEIFALEFLNDSARWTPETSRSVSTGLMT